MRQLLIGDGTTAAYTNGAMADGAVPGRRPGS